MIHISKIAQREIAKGFKGRFIHTENNTLAFWDAEKGAVFPAHSHMHEQTMMVLEGQFELTIAGETTIFGNGIVAVIPPNTIHSGVALTDCKLFDIFSPVREDYKNA